MDSILINTKGQEYIEIWKKRSKQFMFIFPILVLFVIIAGIGKLGFSALSIVAILLVFPVLFIALFSGAIKPQKVAQGIIVKIEWNQDQILVYTEDICLSLKKVESKRNLQVFDKMFLKYYSVFVDSKEYYIIPEFFDDFEMFEKRLPSKATLVNFY